MNETLDQAIDVLGRLQFETGGPLLDHIVALKNELSDERLRRIDQLRKIVVDKSRSSLEKRARALQTDGRTIADG